MAFLSRMCECFQTYADQFGGIIRWLFFMINCLNKAMSNTMTALKDAESRPQLSPTTTDRPMTAPPGRGLLPSNAMCHQDRAKRRAVLLS